MEAAKVLPESADYSVLTIPKSKVIYSDFPFRNTMSYMMGPMKVYDIIKLSSEFTT